MASERETVVERIVPLARGAMAAAIAVAVVSQFVLELDRSSFRPYRFFCFFTILSNIAAVALLALLAVRPGLVADGRVGRVRGAITLYMAVTGVVYAVLLAPSAADVGLTEPWVDTVVHVIAPIVVVADWLLVTSSLRFSGAVLVAWLAFPLAYVTFALVHGAVTDWYPYPYPFLDPGEAGGYAGVAVMSAVILVAIVALAAAIRWWAAHTAHRVAA